MTDIIAHRGSKGTHPENTCIAFREAVRVGAEGLELYVHLSKDGYLIVMHDETVDRTTDGHGEIQQLTLNELKQLDAGSWFQKNPSVQCVPTLEDVLNCLVEEQFNGFLNIELKTDIIHYEGIEKKVVQQMKQKKWPFRYLYSSFYFPSLVKLKKADPKTEIAFIYESAEDLSQAGPAFALVDSLHPKMSWVLAHEKELITIGKPLRPWTVNRMEEMENCFQLKLAGVHTDFPEEAKFARQNWQEEGET